MVTFIMVMAMVVISHGDGDHGDFHHDDGDGGDAEQGVCDSAWSG